MCLQDDRPVGGRSHVHGPRLRQPFGRDGARLRLPPAGPAQPGAPAFPFNRNPGLREVRQQHRPAGRPRPGWLQWSGAGSLEVEPAGIHPEEFWT